ncbi:hypothetical protein NMY22_g5558 [Coprinellus aureogranulatus]|nr:hypothetical protein NMY22_g5558 [Coprinellus aureogranulatus]
MEAVDHPLINWHSQRILLFKRTRGLQREALATKAAICSVCRHWNTLALPWLYEHIVVDNARKLRSVNLLPLTNSSLRSLSYVQRLDVELPEGDMLWPFVAIVEILRSLPNLTTLVMFFSRSFSCHTLLPYIPKSVERLYWSTPKDDAKSLPEAPMDIDIPVLLDFLEGHPALGTVSLPFIFLFQQPPRHYRLYESRTPHALRLRVGDAGNISVASIRHRRPSKGAHRAQRILRERYTYEWPESGMTALLTGSPSYPPTGFVQDTGAISKSRTSASSSICPTEYGLQGSSSTVSPRSPLYCPNLREFNLTFTADDEIDESPFISPLEAVHRSTEISDLEGTLHHVLRLPWKDMFPSLQCIRVREDMDLDTLVRHPTMVIAKSEELNSDVSELRLFLTVLSALVVSGQTPGLQESGIRYEDRFGELF